MRAKCSRCVSLKKGLSALSHHSSSPSIKPFGELFRHRGFVAFVILQVMHDQQAPDSPHETAVIGHDSLHGLVK